MVKAKLVLKRYWPLFLVVLLGGVLRLYGLLQNPISLYSDEVDIGYQVLSLVKTGCDYSGYCLPTQFHSFSDVRTPLPIYFTAIIHLLGVPLDFAIRLSPAIFGILGLLSTYLLVENLASEKIFNLKISNSGLFSALVLALIPWHLTYSRIGFELSTLYFFITFGLYLFTGFLIQKKIYLLILSSIVLGLTPMVYSTAKMAILAYPLILLLLPGTIESLKDIRLVAISLVLMFLPLSMLLISGGAASRFDYISIFTDPTTAPEINYQRQLDSGPNASVGTSPTVATRLLHNKPLWFATNLSNNVFSLLSTDFLFTKGDPNLRHSPTNSGMLYRTLLPVILIGLYFLVRFRHDRFLILLTLLTGISISTSAITRDGGNHASRSFMLILPLVTISGIGLAYLFSVKKFLSYVFLGFIFLESIFFVHDYWFHYRYSSERSWSAGMKEMVQLTKKFPGKPVVISPKIENPLIFYLYYTQFDPKKFQQFVKSDTIYNGTSGNHNLDGNRIGDSNLYIATLTDYQNKPINPLPGAVYFLTRAEVENTTIRSWATTGDIIRLPSGDPLYYEIHF